MKKIGIVGVGCISGIYLENITKVFSDVDVIGVCDLIRERAESAVKRYRIPKLYENMHELFADDEVDIVLNLTRPYQHYEVSRAALLAGKHVYSEKPLGASWEEGVELVRLAEEKGLMIGGAPDTFLGAGIQTCRKLIDEGAIGDVVGATAFMTGHGPESWHPDPAFFYQYCGGPMMDMGPYYVTALINLLGGVKRVGGMVATPFAEREATCKEHYGEMLPVSVPTSYYGVLEFASGVVASIMTSFDIYGAKLPIIEIYGSKGTLRVPDPNCFGGPVILHTPGKGDEEIPLAFDYPENSRMLGLADMASALEKGRLPRASYKQTLHVLEVLTGFERAAKSGGYLDITSKYERSAPMNAAQKHGVLD
ncbi:MAG: Gfo/Idh/MocA family oxidoreductase [Clostridia bacterium]|nr:Gfo/Idh/MocA family oxidoreductase [Clostridia bacterium]